ncbi:MAG: hypothetical protein ACM3NT_01550 [Methylocystaceae bacterium]
MFKRKLIMLTICFMVLSIVMVSGCGSKEKPASSPTAAEKPQAEAGKSGDLDNIIAGIQKMPGYSCEMIMTSDGAKQMTAKLWASGNKLRMEMEAEGQKSIIIINGKGETWNYTPTENMAIKMAAAPQTELPTDWAASEEKPQIVGEEKVDGYDCIIVTSPGEKDTKCWVMKDNGLPVKIEGVIDGKKALIEYKNYNINQQAEDLFTVPAGAQVMTMPGAS